jgi:hypothetical protein
MDGADGHDRRHIVQDMHFGHEEISRGQRGRRQAKTCQLRPSNGHEHKEIDHLAHVSPAPPDPRFRRTSRRTERIQRAGGVRAGA